MDYGTYRASASEQARTADLARLIGFASAAGGNALDVGARDGHFSLLLARHYGHVTALDLVQPTIAHASVTCVQGSITGLPFGDGSFALVLCAEVLEHIPKQLLQRACTELSRVAGGYLLIGVPYRQDIRVGRTTCYTCGKPNPPWGHVNSFDMARLKALFPAHAVVATSYVGEINSQTNLVARFLADLAGNPYGTYDQEEPCIHCGAKLKPPPARTVLQKICTRLAARARRVQKPFCRPHPIWVHLLLKPAGHEA